MKRRLSPTWGIKGGFLGENLPGNLKNEKISV
jgi:hypothetical protein